MTAPLPSLESETTPEGEQTLLAGVAPINLRERLQFKAKAPLEPRAPQKRCDHGLFDQGARAQIDLIDELRRFQRLSQPQPKPKE